MLKIIEQNRSYICLEDTEGSVCFFHYKSLRALDKNLAMYNELPCSEFCKGKYQFTQDDDFSLFVYYKDGSTYNGEQEVRSMRIPAIEAACISTPNGDEFYGDLWKITYNNELNCHFVREVGECYEDEVDVYSYGELYESQ